MLELKMSKEKDELEKICPFKFQKHSEMKNTLGLEPNASRVELDSQIREKISPF